MTTTTPLRVLISRVHATVLDAFRRAPASDLSQADRRAVAAILSAASPFSDIPNSDGWVHCAECDWQEKVDQCPPVLKCEACGSNQVRTLPIALERVA